MINLVLSVFLAFNSFLNFNSTEEKVIEMDRQLNQLISSHNTKAAASFYADDFILTTSSGKTKSKQDMLAEISSTEVTMEINETSGVKVRVIGNTAVLTGTLHQKGVYKGNAFDVRLLVTDTWVKVKTGWKLLAGHATVIKAKE